MDPEQSNAIQIEYLYECMYYKVPRAHEVKNQHAIAKRTYITSNESQLTSSDQQHIYYFNHHQERTRIKHNHYMIYLSVSAKYRNDMDIIFKNI